MRLVNDQVITRAARAEDKDAIVAFCQNTFSWGDYIPDVWDGWIADADGRLIVGIVDDKPVGLAHVKVLEGGVGWMEGMRVHPDFRRHGVSTAMDTAAHDFARTRGCRVARLVTSIKNIAAQKTIATQGYHCVAQFNEWLGEPTDSNRARIAVPDDADHILEMWGQFPVRAAGKVLLPNRDWRWTYLTRPRAQSQIAAGEVRVADHGWMFLLSFDGGDSSSLTIHALVGNQETACALALAARAEAAYRGYPRVEATIAEDVMLNDALTDAGFQREGGMLIYEQIL
ncbi:hypothetical protein ANRL1_03336 [Anaerolineae bacterium]|nr:hypothetical protein ANRL1_03336 [Anaerolineae bacterium]